MSTKVIIDCDELNDDNIKIDVTSKTIEVNTLTTYRTLISYICEIWRNYESDVNGDEYIKHPIPHLYSMNTTDRTTWFLPDWEIKNLENLVRYE